MKPLPAWLAAKEAPKVIVEAMKHYGTLEHKGPDNNPDLIKWAKEIGVGTAYTDDSIPWCGLFVAICVKRSGYQIVSAPLWARNWIHFGNHASVPMFGDVLVFARGGSGHVGFYVAENEENYYVLGGNQSDAVSLAWVSKSRLLEARRCPWAKGQPVEVEVIKLNESGAVSTNEK